MKILFPLLLAVMMSGCDGADAPRRDVADKAVANVVYSKDARTGLCFGTITSTSYAGYSVVSITAVPCASVEKYLVQP